MDLSITPFNRNNDLHEIYLWDAYLKDTEDYKNIENFVLDSNQNETIYELVNLFDWKEDLPYEKIQIFVARANNNEIVGILIARLADWDLEKSNLYISYIIVKPTMQKQHIGTNMLHELLENSKEYFGYTPTTVTAVIHNKNIASMKLFAYLGFKLKSIENQFYATATMENILKTINAKQPNQ